MYAVSIIGLDREGNEHYVDIPDFKYTDTISCVINHAIEDITGAPWFCIVDSDYAQLIAFLISGHMK